MKMFRFALGRYLIHLGLAILPAGRAKTELTNLFTAWSERVRDVLAKREQPYER